MSDEATAKAISSAKKRRGVPRASITRLSHRLRDLEARSDDPNTPISAQQMLKNLEKLDVDFRSHHLALIDLLEEEGPLEKEEETLDQHDDIIGELSTRLNLLTQVAPSDPPSMHRKVVTRRLNHLKKNLSSAQEDIGNMTDCQDICLVRQHEEQLLEFKELGDISRALLSLDLEDSDELMSTLESELFNRSGEYSTHSKPLLLMPPPHQTARAKV